MHIDQLWCQLAVNTCVADGIDHFFLAPGSRCTPLTLAVAQNQDAKVLQHFDERALAFATVGYARATGKPGVFICTSGTAVANAYPAVIEASMEHVPMLLFTADRPPELRGTGANQTIDQQRIFGNYPRWFFDMPCPKDWGSSGDFVASQMSRAIERSIDGPVHLNWMFREPFGIEDRCNPSVAGKLHTVTEPISAVARNTAHEIEVTGNVAVVVGGCHPREAVAASLLAEKLNSPLITDITSGLRRISPDAPTNFDLPEPDTVIHLGGRIISKAWMKYTANLKTARHVHLTPYDVRINPNHLNIERIVTPLVEISSRVAATKPTSDEFRDDWEKAEESRRKAIRDVLETDPRLSEPGIAFALAQELQEGHGLFLGNSTPIRDMDWFAHWPAGRDITVGANRGASGIDGLIASSVGFAKGLDRPTTLLLGDLSALHDLNSLALVAKSEVPVMVLIVNNQGGGIFDLLPIVKQTKHFEQYFVTPHQFSFKHAASMFGLGYQRVSDTLGFESAYREGCDCGSSVVIELATDRKFNMEVRRLIDAEIAK